MADDLDKHARAFQKSLAGNPELTVDELADEHGLDHATAARILDEYTVDGGKVRHSGPGAGGGWVPEPTEEAPGE